MSRLTSAAHPPEIGGMHFLPSFLRRAVSIVEVRWRCTACGVRGIEEFAVREGEDACARRNEAVAAAHRRDARACHESAGQWAVCRKESASA